jgi:hypothetical protein
VNKKAVALLIIGIIAVSAIVVYAFTEVKSDKSPHLDITVNEFAVSHTEPFPFRFTVTPVNFKDNYKYGIGDINMTFEVNNESITASMKSSLTAKELSDSSHSVSDGHLQRPTSNPVQYNATLLPIPLDFDMKLSLYVTYGIIEYDIDGSTYIISQSNRTISLYSPNTLAAIMTPQPEIDTGSVANAHSLQYSASYTSQGVTNDFTFYAKNIGTSKMMMKIQGTYAGQQMTMIVNGVQHKVWMNAMGQWIDYSDYFDTEWSALSQSLNSTRSGLGNWNGQGDYTYTDPSGGYSVHVYNIHVNPDLADSIFVHS